MVLVEEARTLKSTTPHEDGETFRMMAPVLAGLQQL